MKYLIVGLGNIGDAYASTRHNVGFDCLDYLSEKYDFKFSSDRFGQYGHTKYRGRNLHFLKPDTYMNLSGQAVNFWINKLSVPLNHVLILTDDLNLPFGTLRLKARGSSGGHNGLKNIEEVLASQNYPRLRFGISSEFSPGQQIDYVLSTWTEDEKAKLPELFELVKKAIEELTFRGIGMAMNSLNTRK